MIGGAVGSGVSVGLLHRQGIALRAVGIGKMAAAALVAGLPA